MNSAKASVLLADDDPHLMALLQRHIEEMGFTVIPCPDRPAMLAALEQGEPDVVLLDLRFGQHDGEAILQEQLAQRPGLAIILFTSHASIDSAVNAIKLGAFDYLVKPLDMTRLKVALNHAVEKKRMAQRLAHLENLVVEDKSPPLWRL